MLFSVRLIVFGIRYRANLLPAVELNTGEKVVVVSSTVALSCALPPTKALKPVLDVSLPLYNLLIPLAALIAPLPLTLMSPPVAVPIVVLLPALNTIAPSYPVAVVVDEVVLTGSVRLMSPAPVSIRIFPVE